MSETFFTTRAFDQQGPWPMMFLQNDADYTQHDSNS